MIEVYRWDNGWTARREGDNHHWHLRREDGSLVDIDKYRHDLFDRYDLEWIDPEEVTEDDDA